MVPAVVLAGSVFAVELAGSDLDLVGLDSLDQLVLRDILVFLGLAALLVFYTAKSGSRPSDK